MGLEKITVLKSPDDLCPKMKAQKRVKSRYCMGKEKRALFSVTFVSPWGLEKDESKQEYDKGPKSAKKSEIMFFTF